MSNGMQEKNGLPTVWLWREQLLAPNSFEWVKAWSRPEFIGVNAEAYIPRERWDELKRLLTNRMNFERDEVLRRGMAEGKKNALLNQATAFEFALSLMRSFEEDGRDGQAA